MEKKTILIIGKNGQLAQALLSQASSFDFNKIVAFNREELNVLDEVKLKEVLADIKPDIVVNTSTMQVMSQCENDPYGAFKINFLAVKNLANLCKENKAILVTFSSDYVFSGRQDRLNEEIDKTEPLQMYGLSKLAGEYAVLTVYPEGTYVIRTCGLYGGLFGSPDKGNFVLNMIKEAQAKDLIEVSSDQIVSPTFADDLSKAVLKLLDLKAEPGIYHLINEGSCSWYEFTQEIFKLANIKKELRGVDRGGFSGNSNRPKFSALKNVKAKALGVSLPTWQQGLKTYIDFLKDHNRLKN